MLEGGGDGPMPLNLPPGKLFFGYAYVPYTPPSDTATPASTSATTSTAFTGGGNTLSGRRVAPAAPEYSTAPPESGSASAHDWGSGGQALGSAALPLKQKKKKALKGDVIEID
jgi:ubiquitin fusion degradation protein 1